ncbi:MAG: SCO family protein [Vicinamibacterales bacterium]
MAAIAALACVSTACARTIAGQGLVLAVDPSARRVVVSHKSMGDYMPAMVMPFTLGPRERTTAFQAGDRIAFRLVVRRDRTFIERVRPLSAARVDVSRLAGRPPSLVPVGEIVPPFTLTTERESSLDLASLRGQVVAINFVYTRCPLPDYCPLLVDHFKALSRRFGAQLGRELTLLTISFDPKYDTPAVLRAFAREAGAPDGWHFLTGSADAIEAVCDKLGVEYWADEGLISHTLQTIVIDREGRLAAAVEGKSFTVTELGDLIAYQLNRR